MKQSSTLLILYEGALAPEYNISQSIARNEDGGLFEIIIRGSVGPEDDNLKLPDIRVLSGTLGMSKEDFMFMYHSLGVQTFIFSM